MGKLLGIMRKAGWNLGDQILSAASNVALSIIVANSVDKYVFGAFAIAFVVFVYLQFKGTTDTEDKAQA